MRTKKRQPNNPGGCVRMSCTELDWYFVDRNYRKSSGECRARSDCTYVQADLAPHSPQK